MVKNAQQCYSHFVPLTHIAHSLQLSSRSAELSRFTIQICTRFPVITGEYISNLKQRKITHEFSAILRMYKGHLHAVSPLMDLERLSTKAHNALNATY